MSGINYSKWDNIQLSSDDDEDCHPNIEKYTWRRLRAQQRADAEAKRTAREKQLKAQLAQKEKAVREQKAKASTLAASGDATAAAQISKMAAETEKAAASKKRELEKLDKQKKMTPELMCHVAEERTMLNSNPKLEHNFPSRAKKSTKSESEEADDFGKFMKRNTRLLQQFSEISDLGVSEKFIVANPVILSEHGTGWLLLESLKAEMAGDSDKMRQIVRQNQLLQYTMDLAAMTKDHVLEAAQKFFRSMQIGQKRHMFERDVDDFAAKIKTRAVEKAKEQAAAAAEEEETVELTREERLGPGGLDPIEVLESLPPAMKEAFLAQDVPALHKVLETMTVEEATKHMGRCKASGLWNADPEPETEAPPPAPQSS